MYVLPVLEAGSPRSRCQQGWFLLRAMKEGSVPGLSPWLVDGCLLPVSTHGLPAVCVWVLISSSYTDTSQIGLDPHF